MKKVCIFCGKSAPEVKMSNEHVIRSFLSSYLPSTPTGTNWEQTYVCPERGRLVQRNRKIPRSPLQATSNDVCKNCNEGWLNNKVEIPVEQELGNLIQGRGQYIDQKTGQKISTWAAKTSMVRARMDTEPYPIPQAHHAHLMNTLTPPIGTYVWLGFAEYDPNTFIRQFKFSASYDENPRQRGHLTTLIIGHMAIYVLGCEGKSVEEIIEPAIKYIDSHDLLRLYPNGITSSWPRSMPMPIDQAKLLSSAMASYIGLIGEGGLPI